MDEKNNAKQMIMTCALELFSSKGYEGVSVSELSEAAGITKPTIYYYFGNKEGVFDEVSRLHYSRLNAVIAENTKYHANVESYFEDVYLTLTKVTDAYFKFAVANEAFYRLILANLSVLRSSPVFDVVARYHFVQYDIIDDMFRSMAKAHGSLKGKSKTLTWSFIGIINSYIGLYFSGISELDLSYNSVKELVHQFMHGIYV